VRREVLELALQVGDGLRMLLHTQRMLLLDAAYARLRGLLIR
jgi:hypothetical protein